MQDAAQLSDFEKDQRNWEIETDECSPEKFGRTAPNRWPSSVSSFDRHPGAQGLRPVMRGNATQTSVDNDVDHARCSGSVGGGILKAGDLRVNAVTVSSETTDVDLPPSSNDSDGVSKTEVTCRMEFRNTLYGTHLHYACRNESIACTELLLKMYTNITIPLNEKIPLHDECNMRWWLGIQLLRYTKPAPPTSLFFDSSDDECTPSTTGTVGQVLMSSQIKEEDSPTNSTGYTGISPPGRIQRFLGGTSQTSLKRDQLNRITDCISELASAGHSPRRLLQKTGAQREPLPTYSPNQTRQRIIPKRLAKYTHLFRSEKIVEAKKDMGQWDVTKIFSYK
ncbi:hypothetical protein CDAR_265201 [Caerostris darwini]|uniref:Uncharacterized protein n=1 Tax=Caerostris darwini TaxID=1538125 RepID=A0AAV4W2Q6_9ARAC|nr:hypothetical protein CDAR_265201 [Caerostris darwini]